WLASQLQQAAGKSVTYKRGSLSVVLTATPSTQVYEIVDTAGLSVEVTSRDYIFTRSELVLAGQAIEVRQQDIITEVVGSETVEHEVMLLGKRPVVEWMDTDGTMVMVHTKRIKVNA